MEFCGFRVQGLGLYWSAAHTHQPHRDLGSCNLGAEQKIQAFEPAIAELPGSDQATNMQACTMEAFTTNFLWDSACRGGHGDPLDIFNLCGFPASALYHPGFRPRGWESCDIIGVSKIA